MSYPAQYPGPRPMDVGQILTRVLSLVRANLRVFVGMAAVPPVVIYGLLAMMAAAVLIPMFGRLHEPPTPQLVMKILLVVAPLAILVFVLYWLAFAVYLAAGSHAAVQADCGVPVTFSGSYGVAIIRAGRYFLLLLIIYAICFFPALFIQLAMAALMGLSALNKTQPNPFLFLMFPFGVFSQMALMVAGFVIGLRFSLAFPASVMENLPAIEALKRSNVLTRGARLKIFLALLVIYAATYAAMLILMGVTVFVVAIGLFAVLGLHLHFSAPVLVVLAIVAGAGFMALMVLFMACSWAGFTTALCVIYNDQRQWIDLARTEGPPAGVSA